MATFRFRSMAFPDLPRLRDAIDPALTLDLPAYALHVDVTIPDATFEPALNVQMERLGFLPSAFSAGRPPLSLRSPDSSLWDFRIEDTGILKVHKEGTAVDTVISPKNVFSEIVADTTTASNVFVDLLLAAITTEGGAILCQFTAGVSSTLAATARFRITVDGVPLRGVGSQIGTAGPAVTAAILAKTAPLAAGVHDVRVQWSTSLGTIRIRPVANPDTEHGSLLVTEVPL